MIRDPVPASGFAPVHGTERGVFGLSAGGAGDERGDDVGGVAVQRLAATVTDQRAIDERLDRHP
jgi:hypothetical protein